MPQPHTVPAKPRCSIDQRGGTLVSVLLLLLALTIVALLSVRSSSLSMRQAGAAVAHERAYHSAVAALALAHARLTSLDGAAVDSVLVGSRPQGPNCNDPCRDCRPDGVELTRGGMSATCVTPPCMRPGAVARLGDRDDVTTHWCDIPLRQLSAGADIEAQVSVWARNDRAEGLDAAGWTHDANRRVVLTAAATVRGTRVVVQQEVILRR